MQTPDAKLSRLLAGIFIPPNHFTRNIPSEWQRNVYWAVIKVIANGVEKKRHE